QHTAELGWSFARGVARSPRVGADERRRGCIAACGVFAKSNFRAPACPRRVKDEKAGPWGRPSRLAGRSGDPHGWPPSPPTPASAGGRAAGPAGIGGPGLVGRLLGCLFFLHPVASPRGILAMSYSA